VRGEPGDLAREVVRRDKEVGIRRAGGVFAIAWYIRTGTASCSGAGSDDRARPVLPLRVVVVRGVGEVLAAGRDLPPQPAGASATATSAKRRDERTRMDLATIVPPVPVAS
jgi:hypothetical protein